MTKTLIFKLIMTEIIIILACILSKYINNIYASILIGFISGEIVYRLIWKLNFIERR